MSAGTTAEKAKVITIFAACCTLKMLLLPVVSKEDGNESVYMPFMMMLYFSLSGLGSITVAEKTKVFER